MARQIRKVQILKHPNGKSPNWYVRWWELVDNIPDKPKWKEIWRTTGTTVKRVAEQFRRQLERELEIDIDSVLDWSWEQLVDEYVEMHRGRLAPKTIEIYQLSFDEFAKVMNVKSLTEINLTLLENFIQARLAAGAAVATVNRDLRHLRVLFRWAKRRGVLDDIPDFFGLLIKEERRDPTIMPEEDFLALLAALRNPQLKLKKMPPDWWRIFLYLIYYLGVRRGEALGLFWSDISFQANEVRIRAGTSKSRKDRVVPIAAELSDVLKQWKDRSPFNSPNDSVLPWPYDTYRQVYVDWHLIQTAAGIPDGEHYVPKDCRSTCASELTANDVPTVVVRDFLGHASVTTTERYYINTKPAMRAAAQVRKIVREPDEQNQANELDEK